MAVSWVLPVRGVQAVFALIVLGLTGYIVSKYSQFSGDFSPGDFNVFTAVWTILVCVFFVVTSFVMSDSFLGNTIVVVVLDGLTWIFWLAAFASIAAKLSLFDDVNGATHGAFSTIDGTAKAAVGFGVIEWLLFTATLIWNAMTGFRGTKSGGGATQGV